jgi:hypothetical protein
MDYRVKIIELVYKIKDEKLLRFIYYLLDDAMSRYEEM